MKLVFASRNEHKTAEIRAMLPKEIELLSLNDVHFLADVAETASTFIGNARLKANAVYDFCKIPCFADDSGLMVDALNGQPGVFSARFAGPEKDDMANCLKLIEALRGMQNRRASFCTAIVFVQGDKEHVFEGKVDGEIHHEMIGAMGFGYDPLFVPEGWTKTFAQVDKETKNTVSHRGRAFGKFMDFLQNVDNF
jgi:XTP/dITP diphosphohydrolase